MNPQQDTDLPPALSRPAQRALSNAGYQRLEQLAGVSQAEVGNYMAWVQRRSRNSGMPWLRTVYRSLMGRK